MNWKPSKPVDPRAALLMEQRRKLNVELRAKMYPERPLLECKRCGWKWTPMTDTKLPKCCAQCHSTKWQETAKPGDKQVRRPTDPPNPQWKTRWNHAAKKQAGRFASSRKLKDAPKPAPKPPVYAPSKPLREMLKEVSADV